MTDGERRVRRDEGFGRRLVEAMDRRGVRPGELAVAQDVGASTVSRWRRGECPDDLRLPQIAAYLQIPAEWLKTGAGERPAWNEPGMRRTPGRRKADQAVARLADLEDAGETARRQLAEYERAGRSPPSYQILAWFEMLERAVSPPAGDPDPLGRPTPPEGHPIGPGDTPPPPRAAGGSP